MTATEAVIVCLADVEPSPRPRCEALLQCVEQCCEPTPCTRPAAERVSFRCGTAGCSNACRVLLLCTICAEQATGNEPATARRPL